MPGNFKTLSVRPMTGVFDTLSSADEVGWGSWRLVKNATTRSTRNRQRGPGWRRLFADDDPYNNQDLHDQLIEKLAYYDSYSTHIMGGGGLTGYGYPYLIAGYSVGAFDEFLPASGPYCPVYVGDFPSGEYNGCPIFYPFVGYPFNLWPAASYPGACDTGYPDYYVESYLYATCPIQHPAVNIPPYAYGPGFPMYESQFAYDYDYCGTYAWHLPGCREAITGIEEIVTETGRKLIASTMSRAYELNQSSGNWRILADGLGNSGFTQDQCGCNSVRPVMDTMGGYLLYANGINYPMIYFVGDDVEGCDLQALQPIADMVALGITSAGGVVVWKGFAIFFDFTEDGVRNGGGVIWSDLEIPDSFIESDTSLAGRATIAVGETILAAAPLGNWLILYTDKSIIRVTLVGGEDIFNFERIYEGGNALKYKFSLINAGDIHLFLGESDIYTFSQFDTRPVAVNWITRAAGMIYLGIEEDDATYAPLNKDACNLVSGFWSDETHEAFLSWPTGENTCPDVTLRLNLKFGTADLVDHGFTAGMTFRRDDRPTVGQWVEDMGICPRGSLVAIGAKDGVICTGTGDAVVNPPLYIINPEEDPDLPAHPDSLCARLTGKSVDDFCQDCASPATLIVASATDFTLKQMEDDIYYREQLVALGSPCRDVEFVTAYGELIGFSGQSLVLDTWIPLGAIRCTEITGAVKLGLGEIPEPPPEPPPIPDFPCGTEGATAFNAAAETGKTINWNSRWKKIAYSEFSQMVIADSTDDSGISLIDFSGVSPALDHTLPIVGNFRIKGLFYHTAEEKIIALIRYGTDSPPFTYKLGVFHPTNGLESEIDLTSLITTTQGAQACGAAASDIEYEADFAQMDTSRVAVLLKPTAILGSVVFAQFLKVDIAGLVIEESQEQIHEDLNVCGNNSGRHCLGVCYICDGGVVPNHTYPDVGGGATFHQPDGGKLDNQFLFPFGAFTTQIGLAQELWDVKYVNSVQRVFARGATSGVYQYRPSSGTLLTVATFNVAAEGIYNWLCDRYIITDSSTNEIKFINPIGFGVTAVSLTGASSSWYLASSLTNSKTYVHDNDSPFKIHELNVT